MRIAIDVYSAVECGVPMEIFLQWQYAGMTEVMQSEVRYCTPGSDYYEVCRPRAVQGCGFWHGSGLFREVIMPLTVLICGNCGRTQERASAFKAGWLEGQRKDAPVGHLIIKCPDHVTAYALKLAGLPQQRTCARIVDNIACGLWVAYGAPQDGYVASAYESDDGDSVHYVLARHKGEMPPFRDESFTDIPALILAMRKIEKDLRKWKLVS